MFPIYEIKAPMHPLDFCDGLIKANGLHEVGHGFFAKVFGKKECDRVYKIATWDEEDDGYCAFLRTLSKQEQHNPYLPKVYGVWIISYPENESCQYYLAALEKLTPLEFEPESDRLADILHTLLCYPYELKELSTPDTMEQAMLVVSEARENSGHNCIDMHMGNVMVRDNGQLVITDPLI